jgi:hypothetical protein
MVATFELTMNTIKNVLKGKGDYIPKLVFKIFIK